MSKQCRPGAAYHRLHKFTVPQRVKTIAAIDFQPIKQSRRQRQHRQHGCEYNRRCPSIICNPVRQLADRRCAGKDHVNDRKHFSAELSRRYPLNKRDDFNRRNARPHHDPCRTNRKHGEHAYIYAEQQRNNNRRDSKTDHRNISAYAIERKTMRPNADQATAGKTTQAQSNLNYPNAGRCMPRCFVTIMGAPIVSPTNARFKTAASKITATNDAFCNRYRIDSRKSFRHVVRVAPSLIVSDEAFCLSATPNKRAEIANATDAVVQRASMPKHP